MDEEQFKTFMEKLEEIRCCLIDVETTIEKQRSSGKAEIYTG